ncbi:TPA: hypothetical protein ACMDQ5_004583 [Vibrio parahaemolyticus]
MLLPTLYPNAFTSSIQPLSNVDGKIEIANQVKFVRNTSNSPTTRFMNYHEVRRKVDELNSKSSIPGETLKTRRLIMENSNEPLHEVVTSEGPESDKGIWERLNCPHADVQPHIQHLAVMREMHVKIATKEDGFKDLPWNKIPQGEGRAFFVGGTYGSGKSHSLKSAGIDPQDAISPDPVKLALSSGVVPFSPKGISPSRSHTTSSQVAFTAKNKLDCTLKADYVLDGSLRDPNEVKSALVSGKKVIVNFSVVPFQQSLLRVLARDPNGDDPRAPFSYVKSAFQQTAISLKELLNMSQGQYREQFYLQVFSPKHCRENPDNYVLESGGKNQRISHDLIVKYLESYLHDFDELCRYGSRLPTVRHILNSKFFTESERANIMSKPWIGDYLELPINEALDTHANLPSGPYHPSQKT